MHTCLQAALRFSDVHLTAGAWYLVDDVRLLRCRQEVFDLSENATEGGTGLKHRSDDEVAAHLPDPLTNACHIWRVSCRELLGFVAVAIVRVSECS